MKRRTMLGWMVNAGIGLVATGGVAWVSDEHRELPEPSPHKLSRWRGFNLLEMFQAPRSGRFREQDFAAIAELGFNFVRLPLDYRCWTDPGDWTKLRNEPLRWIDEAVELGQKHEIHVQLGFHRAPGYTVAKPPEPRSLWIDPEAQDVCALHWGQFAGDTRVFPAARSVSICSTNRRVWTRDRTRRSSSAWSMRSGSTIETG